MNRKRIALSAALVVVAALVLALVWQPWKPGRKSAENSKLGVVCKSGDCVSVEEAAEKGDRDAQFAVAMGHMTGKGLPKDDAAAVKWFGKSAAQGHRDAQFFLGMAHGKGIGGLKADPIEAAKWLSSSSDLGQPDAQHILGALHYEGKGVKQDYAESERLWRLSGEQGNVGSQYNIAALYFEGRGVGKNDNEALKWLVAAAGGGHDAAPEMLGKLGFQWPADRDKIQERLAAATDLVKRPPRPSPEMLKSRAEKRQKAVELADKGADAADERGRTALSYAVLSGDLELVKSLLDKGASLSGGEGEEVKPLTFAASNGHVEIAKLLIERGAKVDAKDKNGTTPLWAAVGADQNDVAELLMAKGADPNFRHPEYGQTLLHYAADHSDNREIVEILLHKGLDPNSRDRDGQTALHIAVSTKELRLTPSPLGKLPAPLYGRKAEIVAALLKGGADPGIQDNAKMTPLEYALNAQSSEEVVRRSAQQRFKEIEELLRAKPKPPG